MNKNEVEEVFNNLLSLFRKPPEVKLKTFSTWRELLEGTFIEDVKAYLYDEFGLSISDFTAEGFDIDKFVNTKRKNKYEVTDKLREIHKIPELKNQDCEVGAFYGSREKTIYTCPRNVYNVTDALIILLHDIGHAFGNKSEEKAEYFLKTRWAYYYSKYKKEFLKRRR